MSLRVIEWADLLSRRFPKPGPAAMTIGIFDGVHRGHAELIRRVVSRGPNPTVVTFRENPKKLLDPQNYPGDIFTLEQRFAAFEGLGIAQVILIDFSGDFSIMKGQEFIRLLENRGNLNFLVIGENFRCGHKLDTGTALIKSGNEARGIPTEIVLPVREGNEPISSSRIRRAIARGDLPLAALLLGRNVELDLARPGKDGLAFDVSRRLVPPPGLYEVSLRSKKKSGGQVRKGEVLMEAGKVTVLSRNYFPENPEDLESGGGIIIEFLTGPKALERFPI